MEKENEEEGASVAEVAAAVARIEAAADRVTDGPKVPTGKVLDDPATLRAAIGELSQRVEALAQGLDAVADILKRQGYRW
jgi:hypothetical protein